MKSTTPLPKVKFEDCTISFAIDTSGSTSVGGILRLEQQAILDISSKLSPSARSAARILPWASEAGNPIPLSGLANLDSYGGTEPASLLGNDPCRQTLQRSTMWFLLTDGEIFENSKQDFSRRIAANGLHGTACVVVIFGPARNRPASCNISVGVSIFAAAPDCLFLFNDTVSRTLYLLQCSGRFTQVLELHGQSQPILDENTGWKDLPKIQFTDLASISIPAPRALSQDEIALPDGLVLNLRDLFQGRLNDETTIDRIFKDDDNLKSIMLTAQTRGDADAFRQWLQPFTDPSSSPLRPQTDLERKAMDSIRRILQEMNSGVTQERMLELQDELRQSSNVISSYSSPAANQNVDERRYRSSVAAITRSSDSTSRGGSLNSIMPSMPQSNPQRFNRPPLLTPGFKAPAASEAMFLGKCELCENDDTNLVLLLRAPPSEHSTPGFPPPGAAMPLTYPLAVGNFPETDIVSSSICCDACSYHLAQEGETPLEETLSCVIPLVTYAINAPAYKKQLKIGLQNRLSEDDLPQAFLAILINTLQRLPSNKGTHMLLRNAIRWSCKDLLSNAGCPEDQLSILGTQMSANKVISLKDAIETGFKRAHLPEAEDLFQYPLPGFVVMIFALQYAQDARLHPFHLRNQVWQRLLYQITQHYHDYLSSHGQTLAYYKMAEILLEKDVTVQDKATRKNSLKSLRDLGKSLFGDRLSPSDMKTSIDLDFLVANHMLAQGDVVALRAFGNSFQILEQKATSALCIFLHFLARQSDSNLSPWQRFQALRGNKDLDGVFKDPVKISSKHVAESVKNLSPPLVPAT